jgi:excisionase family DNA binding protein
MKKDMANNDKMRPMLTVREVAWLLHVHPNTVRRWADRGMIRAYRITPRGDRRFRRQDIARFLAELDTGKGRSPAQNPHQHGQAVGR